jgi:hypothetical protein
MAQQLLGLRRIVLSWSGKLMVDYPQRGKRVLSFAVVASLAIAGVAQAQSAPSNSASANAYSRALEQQQNTADAVRDANGQPVATDGVTQAGEDQSDFTHDGADGAFDTASGVGASGAATAFGDNLAVVTRAAPAPGADTTQSTSGGAGADPTLSGNTKQ